MLLCAMGSIAARLATLLLVVAIALPYVLRRSRVDARPVPYLRRLSPHFWTGYAVLGLSVVHAGTVGPAMRRANPAGIWTATVAFFLLVIEVIVGLSLRDGDLGMRKRVRRVHFWGMIMLGVLLAAHVWLNG